MSVTKKIPKKASESILSRAVPVAEVEDYSAVLFYGESGTGKTTLAATYPKPLLILDLREHGTRSIKKVKGADVVRIDTWKEYEEIFFELEKDDHYKTIVHDQVSALQALGMDHIRKESGMEPDDTFSKRDWGQLSGLMQTWLLNHRNLYTLSKHIIFLAHQREFGNDDDTSEDDQMAPRMGARLSPSIESFLNGAVSVIGNTFIREKWVQLDSTKPKKTREVKYCLRIGPHGSFRTKIRRPLEDGPVPDVLVNPTYEKIEDLSNGKNAESEEAPKPVKKLLKKV